MKILSCVKVKAAFLFVFTLMILNLSFGQKNEEKYYGKHIVIAIDQTGDVQSHGDIGKVKLWIKQLLCNEPVSKTGMDSQSIMPEGFSFNEKTDRISLFAFGIEGKSASYPYDVNRNSYMRIKNSQHNGNMDNMEIVEAILSQRTPFVGEQGDISTYVSTIINPLLSGNDPKASVIQEIGGVTMSYYVYPPILNLVDVTTPAEEYYFIIITNFKSGSSEGVNSEDEKRLGEILPNDGVRNSFKNMCAKLDEKYTKTKILSIIPAPVGVSNEDAKRPILTMYKLMPIKSMSKGPGQYAEIESNIDVKQKDWNSNSYNVGEVKIKMPGENIRAIGITVVDGVGNEVENSLLAKTMAECQALYSDNDKRYIIPETKIDCEGLEEGSKLEFKYVFYPMKENDNKLPMVYVAKREVELTEASFAQIPPDQKNFYLILSIIIVAVVATLFWLALRWRKKRGENLDVDMEFEILPISNTRYMDVTNNKVENMDCWYMRENEPERLINVEGKLNIKHRVWEKKYQPRLEYWVEDADTDEEYTFRPDGTEANGANKVKNKWYGLPVKKDNTFEFRIVSCFDGKREDDILGNLEEKAHNHKVIVKLRVRLMDDKHLLEKDLTEEEEKSIIKTIERGKHRFEKSYSYTLRPYFERLDAWVAFDPGTTGACVTLGASGLPTDPTNIIVMQNRERRVGNTNNYNSIFPSKVRILDRSRLFLRDGRFFDEGGFICVDEFEEGADNDYVFGNDADNRIGRNIFQSIKKMLGYKTVLKVHNNRNGDDYNIYGKDLAYLLVKGLYKRVEEYVLNDANIDREIKSYYTVDGQFCPQRAIVAVPNNYTVSKIQDMVDTIKRLHKFREVHYLYESEGVLMCFCRKEFAKLVDMQDHIFIVYDMGGATINATAFTITVNTRGTNIDQIKVKTISKIGFCVGGDDIDYAIIKSFYSISQIRDCFNNDDEVKTHMLRHKQALLMFALDIKKMKMKGNECEPREEFVNMVVSRFNEMDLPKSIERPGADLTDEEERKKAIDKFVDEYEKSREANLQNYVYSKVQDAVQELIEIESLEQKNKIMVIFSGRSSTFGKVKDVAMSVLQNKYGKANVTAWDGFNDANGNQLDIEKVKTAVAIGANWYALFSKIVRLEHDIVPTTIGFIDMENNKSVFTPIIERNRTFENGIVEGKKIPSPLLPEVEFVQMQGSNYQQILNDYYGENGIQNRHKMNKLELVRKELIDGRITEIQAKLDESNNFDYTIFSGNIITRETNREFTLLRNNDDIKIEVADENNESYIYAITQPQCVEGDNAEREDNIHRTGSSSGNRKSRKL